jgi:hypothetical protein
MKAKNLKLWQDAPNYLGSNYEGYYEVYSQSDASEISDMANYRVLSRYINGEDCIEASFGGCYGRFTLILVKGDSPLVQEIDNLIEGTKTVYYLLDEKVYGEIQYEKWLEYWNGTGCDECAKEILGILPELEGKIAYRDPYDIDLLIDPGDFLDAVVENTDLREDVDDCDFDFSGLNTPVRMKLRDALMLLVNPNWLDGTQLELTLA